MWTRIFVAYIVDMVVLLSISTIISGATETEPKARIRLRKEKIFFSVVSVFSKYAPVIRDGAGYGCIWVT